MRKKAFITVCFLLIFSSISWAATCPSLTPKPSLTGGGDFAPASVASGNGGQYYVAEFFDDTVTVFSSSGSVLKVLSVRRPVSVAVDDSSGNIYIGNSTRNATIYTGGVTVYDKNLNKLRELGSGFGEFEYPSAVFIKDSIVYVADSRSNVVKAFNEADGSPRTFDAISRTYLGGGRGLNAGDLMRPNGVSVDPLTGNIYVSDLKLQYDASNYIWGMGAGVHIFNSAGEFLRTLPIYFGDNVVAGSQQMLYPAGVQVDGSGMVFVADKSLNKLMVFDPSDAFVCDIPVGGAAARPKGLKLTADGRMILAASEEVLVYETENLVSMAVSPSSASISAQECSASQGTEIITVTNNGGGVLDWSASADSGWITISNASGYINGKGSAYVTLGADTAGLADGEYTGTVTFVSQSGSQAVSVTLTKSAAPSLGVAETSYSFEVRGDVIPSSQALTINLSGDAGGQAAWSASSNSLWLGVSPSSGGSGLSVAQVGVNPAGLAEMAGGTYTGSITVETGCASMDPVVVPVSLNYIKGGTIKVTTNLETSTFRVTGPISFNGSGLSHIKDVVPSGTYKVVFDWALGYMTPASYSLEVAEGATVEFTGNYVDLRENNKLIVSSDLDGMIEKVEGSGGSMGVINVAGSAKSSVSSTASGDFNGDGVDEIVVAHDNGIVTGYMTDGTPIAGMNFTAFKGNHDVVLATADLNGDGIDEIIAAPGEGNRDSAEIKVFGFNGAVTFDTGMSFDAYQKKLGLKIASGDFDGDGMDELVTTRGGKSPAGRSVEVRVFKADTSGGPGSWKARDMVTFPGGTSFGDGLSVAAGDFNYDGIDEIVVASELSKTATMTHVVSYHMAGDRYYSYVIDGTGLRVTSGDVDFDGHSEVVVVDGDSNVRIYDGFGSLETEFKALSGDGVSGAKISLGQIVGK